VSARIKFLTIGVFGSSEREFFNALVEAKVDTFCDIRWRRGVRGSEYKFVNSARLQKKLAELGIRYLHFPELAPTPEIRQKQTAADKASKTAQRKRTRLSEEFIAAYCAERLVDFDARAFAQKLGNAKRCVLFCVEHEPTACHRSLLAKELERQLGVKVTHLVV
jgi:uncharacterized protein (DUF488 family)